MGFIFVDIDTYIIIYDKYNRYHVHLFKFTYMHETSASTTRAILSRDLDQQKKMAYVINKRH